MSISTFDYLVKMEYLFKINIFGLKMLVKSGLEFFFLKFLHAQNYFPDFIKGKNFAQNCKFSNKNDIFCARRDVNENFCAVCTNNIKNETLSHKFHPYSILTG